MLSRRGHSAGQPDHGNAVVDDEKKRHGLQVMRCEGDLARFIRAQEEIYEAALEELHNGRKHGHWVWFVFPQIAGLGNSQRALEYAIRDLDEAKRFMRHPVLSCRLIACAKALMAHENVSAKDILGDVDALKLKSSMTLFDQAIQGEEPVFTEVLDKFYRGYRCQYPLQQTVIC